MYENNLYVFMENLKLQFLNFLKKEKFAEEYYKLYEKSLQEKDKVELDMKAQNELMASFSPPFKYNPSEKFFHSSEKFGQFVIGLNVCFLHKASIELILILKTPDGHLGTVFPALALQVQQLNDAQFTYNPHFPKPYINNSQQAKEVIMFGIVMFQKIKENFLKTLINPHQI